MQPEDEPVVPASEPKQNWVGRIVAFDLHRSTKVTRERGVVETQQWLGRTVRGGFPDWELVICGGKGIRVKVRVMRDLVVMQD